MNAISSLIEKFDTKPRHPKSQQKPNKNSKRIITPTYDPLTKTYTIKHWKTDLYPSSPQKTQTKSKPTPPTKSANLRSISVSRINYDTVHSLSVKQLCQIYEKLALQGTGGGGGRDYWMGLVNERVERGIERGITIDNVVEDIIMEDKRIKEKNGMDFKLEDGRFNVEVQNYKRNEEAKTNTVEQTDRVEVDKNEKDEGNSFDDVLFNESSTRVEESESNVDCDIKLEDQTTETATNINFNSSPNNTLLSMKFDNEIGDVDDEVQKSIKLHSLSNVKQKKGSKSTESLHSQTSTTVNELKRLIQKIDVELQTTTDNFDDDVEEEENTEVYSTTEQLSANLYLNDEIHDILKAVTETVESCLPIEKLVNDHHQDITIASFDEFVESNEERGGCVGAPSFIDSYSSKILTPKKKKKHDCDMIVCGVKTKTVDGHKVHEIDLKCHGCDSQFVLSAVHECEDDEDIVEGEDGQLVSTTNQTNQGLEWLKDDQIDMVNVIL